MYTTPYFDDKILHEQYLKFAIFFHFLQSVVQNLVLIAFTGMINPMIMSNWKHLLPELPGIHHLHDQLMEDLQRVSEKVEALNAATPNARRPRICQSFNPKFLECSVSL